MSESQRMDFGCLIINERVDPDHRPVFERRLHRLEEHGFHNLAMPDSQSLWPELHVQLSLMAMATERVILWPATTNPHTRHPALMASSIAAIDELSGGRAWFNLGSGDSAVYNLGLKGASLATLRNYLVAMRSLFETGEAEWEDRSIRLKWPGRRVPLYLTAEGPRTLELAGELADGVLCGVGLQAEPVADALAAIERGAARSGRTLDDIDIWWFVKWNMDDDRERSIREARMTLTASANHAFRFTLEGKHIPEEHHQAIRELQRRYAFAEHEATGGERANALIVDELGLTSYLADRFLLCGPPAEFRDRLKGLADLGVSKVLLAFFGETDRDAKHDRLAAEVLPAFR
jgi:5,10-methylenetetrahydromethanopterin reductase